MEHNIVMDLLPLYHDGICSEESKTAVEEHLQSCEVCRKALEDMDAPLPEVASAAQKDKAMMQGLSHAWKKGKGRAFLKGALAAVLACALVMVGWHLLFVQPLVSYDGSEIVVKDLYQLQDGRLYFTLQTKSGRVLDYCDYDYKTLDGQELMIPKRTVFQHPDAESWRRPEFLNDLAEHNEWNAVHGDGKIATEIYIGTKQDRILLWKEGMELPAAPAEIEAEYGFSPGSAVYWANRAQAAQQP